VTGDTGSGKFNLYSDNADPDASNKLGTAKAVHSLRKRFDIPLILINGVPNPVVNPTGTEKHKMGKTTLRVVHVFYVSQCIAKDSALIELIYFFVLSKSN